MVLLFSGINVHLRYFSVRYKCTPEVLFSQVFEKANCNAFKNVMKNGCLLTTRIHLGNKLSWLMEEPSLPFHEQTLVFVKA